MQTTTQTPARCGHVHTTWPRPAACDPEPDREAEPAAWWAWRFREQHRQPNLV